METPSQEFNSFHLLSYNKKKQNVKGHPLETIKGNYNLENAGDENLLQLFLNHNLFLIQRTFFFLLS